MIIVRCFLGLCLCVSSFSEIEQTKEIAKSVYELTRTRTHSFVEEKKNSLQNII